MLDLDYSMRNESPNYWNGRVLDAQLSLSQAASPRLRGVYSELVGHYQRMAELYALGN